MILRKISGSRNAWAWLTAWAIARSQSDCIGRISGCAGVAPAAASSVGAAAAAVSAGPGMADTSASSASLVGSTSLMAAHSRRFGPPGWAISGGCRALSPGAGSPSGSSRVRSLQSRPSPWGSGCPGSVSARSHCVGEPVKRAAKSGRTFAKSSWLRRVFRTTYMARTLQVWAAGVGPRRWASVTRFPSMLLNPAPTSSNQSQISATIASLVGRRTRATSIERDLAR